MIPRNAFTAGVIALLVVGGSLTGLILAADTVESTTGVEFDAGKYTEHEIKWIDATDPDTVDGKTVHFGSLNADEQEAFAEAIATGNAFDSSVTELSLPAGERPFDGSIAVEHAGTAYTFVVMESETSPSSTLARSLYLATTFVVSVVMGVVTHITLDRRWS